MTVEEWLGQDNKLGIDIWHKKYQRNNETFEEWLQRVSGNNEQVSKLIKEKKFLFGGRILSNRGIDSSVERVSLSNCYVISPPDDSIESIYDTCKKLARTYSYGGGCGIDISKLAPEGAKVHNQAKSTSGAVSFMDTFSQVTAQIGQNGRRGALMISINCTHPDLEKFITVKSDLGKVTSANISVRVSDDFMTAVVNDWNWELSFTRPETDETITKTVKAKDIYHLLCKNNWDYAEPGILFWDRIKNWNLLSEDDEFEYAGTNPCAEEPLPAGGSCLLGAINLAEFVKDKKFDHESFCDTVRVAVSALNDVLDEGISKHPLQEQRDSVRDWRQIGLGIMGLADMLIKCELIYGSKESLKLCDDIGYNMACVAIDNSAQLAQTYGTYPKYKSSVLQTQFFKKHSFSEKAKQYGLYNSQLLTVAPTGTISTMLMVSGGIEPIFANSYTRITKSLFGRDEAYKVYTPIVKDFMDNHNIIHEEDLPTWFVTSSTIPIDQRINMQSVWQNHIDASISSTVNLPHESTVNDVENLYMQAWKQGLKGITVYRAGCAREGILVTEDNNSNTVEKKDHKTIERGMIMGVPDDLTYRKYCLRTGCGKLYLFVGIDDITGAVYDCFTNTDGVGGCTVNTQAVSRLISACIRGGVPIEYVIEQLQKAGSCPSYQYAKGAGKNLSKGKSCASAISNVLKDIVAELNIEEYSDETEIEQQQNSVKKFAEKCPECGEELIFEGGCCICKSCGFSRCN